MKRIFRIMIMCTGFLITASRGLTQKPVTVALRVNYSDTARVYHDEPLLFTVSVANKGAQGDARWNKAADRRLAELEDLLKTGKISRAEYVQETKELNEGKRKISSFSLGSGERSWSSLVSWKVVDVKTHAEIQLALYDLPNPPSDFIAILGEKGYYEAYFGTDSADEKKLPEGEYDLIASIGGESSDPVHLHILKGNMPADLAGSNEMLLKLGQYYWHLMDGRKMMQYADMILRKNPASVDGLSLKGDAQIMMKSYQPALETFKEAVKQYQLQNPGGSEPPEYLLEMISWIKTQVN